MIKVAAVVILYYPDKEILDNILSYCKAVEKLYVFDNSESKNEEIFLQVSNISNISYYHDAENMGIAVRLNQAAKLAVQDGFNLLLTMDQDSKFTGDNFPAYLRCVEQDTDKDSVAMYGVEYEKEVSDSKCNPIAVHQLITSGSIVNLEISRQIGGFNELLFIDEVDLEYCYRSLQAGFKVLKFTNIHLQHSLGSISYHTSLKSFKSSQRTLHSPVRVYYMVRNHLYVRKKYKAIFKTEITRSRRTLLNRVKNNLLYGKRKWEIVKYLFLAISDYSKGKMGKKDSI
jgi:rhamnosyltransferase